MWFFYGSVTTFTRYLQARRCKRRQYVDMFGVNGDINAGTYPIVKDWEVLCTIVDFWVVVERHLDTDSI
ncbi:hypothetical protein DER46DRAFT_609838 [Fusarium sp. MPI-SDFR-AT-0072]|nr:hypothetical protein DER46DRAFT_609838 [Fusarium sp. MPI-SDFR-AT-0072]